MNKSSFSTELQLVEMFSKFLRQGGVSNDVHIASEVETGYGIADLVLYSLDNDHHLEISRFSEIPQRFAVLLSNALKTKKFDPKSLSVYTGVNDRSSKSLLYNFVKLNVARRINSDIYEISKYKNSPISKIVSIEAKLSNWKRALDQAYRYKEFSHQSWVLLDHSKIGGALKNIDRFKKAGVGLASFSTTGNLYLLATPKWENPKSNEKYWSASVVLAKAKLSSIKDHLSIF